MYRKKDFTRFRLEGSEENLQDKEGKDIDPRGGSITKARGVKDLIKI